MYKLEKEQGLEISENFYSQFKVKKKTEKETLMRW